MSQEQKDDFTRVDTMGTSDDSRTASENEVIPTYDALHRALMDAFRTYGKAAQSARTTDAGFDSWWEWSGYADVLHDAIMRIARHRRRVEGVQGQIAREAAKADDAVDPVLSARGADQ